MHIFIFYSSVFPAVEFGHTHCLLIPFLSSLKMLIKISCRAGFDVSHIHCACMCTHTMSLKHVAMLFPMIHRKQNMLKVVSWATEGQVEVVEDRF